MAASIETRYDQSVLGGLAEVIKCLFTFLVWCLVLTFFFSNWHPMIVTGLLEFLSHVVTVSLMMWPWMSVVISGVIFTIEPGDNESW